MTPTRIRIADRTDAPTLRNIGEQTFVDTYAAFNTPENMAQHIAQKFSLAAVEAELLAPHITYLVVEAHGQVVAYAKLIESPVPAALGEAKAVEIERFYAVAAVHGQGVGSLLMQHCIDWAIQQGYEQIWLGVWEHNPKAMRFYEKMGFSAFGEHTFWLGNDPQRDLLLHKHLL